MIEEAGSGTAARRNPEAGWYPDPVGRAAQRYWNGNEWTTNTRGPAPPAGAPGAAPARAHAEVLAPDTSAPDTSATDAPTPDTSATDAPTPDTSATGAPTPTVPTPAVSIPAVPTPAVSIPAVSIPAVSIPAVSDLGSTETAGWTASADSSPPSKRPTSWLLGGLAIGLIAFVVGIAVDRTLLASDGVDQPITVASTTTTEPVSPTTTPESSAAVEELETQLAALREESSAALAEAQANNEVLTAQVANLTTHVQAMRTWFTAEVLARAQATFDAEVTRACAAPEDPTLDNTRYVRGMEPAGTHVDVVNAAIDCRRGNG